MKLQINPLISSHQDKKILMTKGYKLIDQFLSINKIPLPKIAIDNKINATGCYCILSRDIYINLKACSTPTKKPGYRWSFPGYKADLTPIGVLTHEIGHYIHYKIDYSNLSKNLNNLWLRQTENEKSITSYDKNNCVSEQIAESLKVFITNPNLLKVGRPIRYNFLVNEFNLIPLHDEPWQEILKYADEKYIKAANNWIK